LFTNSGEEARAYLFSPKISSKNPPTSQRSNRIGILSLVSSRLN